MDAVQSDGFPERYDNGASCDVEVTHGRGTSRMAHPEFLAGRFSTTGNAPLAGVRPSPRPTTCRC